ncbi:MAG TPA: hypothetical protein DCZ08_03680 [Anaerolineaceae bacterium]|nr:hypothetical protein [Anaerolineaceae bacterium]
MTQETNENRIVRTYSLLELTEKMVVEISKKTFRSKANVIDLAVAELYARVMASEGESVNEPEQVSK